MKIQKINNSPSFGAWTQDSQKVLKHIVAKLDKKEAQKVMTIVERLQHNSSNYCLVAEEYSLSALVKPEYSYRGSSETFNFITNGFFSRFKSSVLGAFKKLEEHVTRTNDIVPVNKQNYDVISSRIEPLFDKNSDFGFSYLGKEDMAYSLTLLSSKKNGAKRVDSAVEQLFAIDKRAKKDGFSIDLDNFDFDVPTVRISLKQKDNQRYALALFKLDCDIDKGIKRINAEMTSLKVQATVIGARMKVVEPVANVLSKGVEKLITFFDKKSSKINPEELSSKIDKIFK